MTAKLVSWSTFGLLVAGAFPFVSDTSVAPAASSDLARYAYTATNSLPACGKCRIKPDAEFQKIYAVDRNALCTAAKPYRQMVRLSTKVFCENGTYWVCDDTSSMTCGIFQARPECPSDSCMRTADSSSEEPGGSETPGGEG